MLSGEFLSTSAPQRKLRYYTVVPHLVRANGILLSAMLPLSPQPFVPCLKGHPGVLSSAARERLPVQFR